MREEKQFFHFPCFGPRRSRSILESFSAVCCDDGSCLIIVVVQLFFKREIAVGWWGILTQLDTIFERHQQWIHVLEAFEFGLVDFFDDTFVVGCQMNGFVGEFRWEVGEILSEKFVISHSSILIKEFLLSLT